jgi:ATP-dependent Lon protease
MPDAPPTTETTPLTLPLLPLSGGVVFPEMVVTVELESDEARRAAAAAHDDQVLLVPEHDGGYAAVGTVARIEQRGDGPEEAPAAVLRGVRRARIGRGSVDAGGALMVSAEPVVDPEPTEQVRELAERYKSLATGLLTRLGGRRLGTALAGVSDPGALADTIGWWPELSSPRRIELLETTDVERRLELAIAWVTEATAVASVDAEVDAQVSDELDQAQRETILRRRLAAIRRELGEGDGEDDVAELRRRLDEAEMPDDVRAAAHKEVDRLERQGEQSMEASWIRTWLDTVFDVPWSVRTEDDLDLDRARAVLDADHTGLDEVKDRIVEFLAVRRLRRDRGVQEPAGRRGGGTIVALAGPPGVGKTSLGESVARALGREFVRMSLGGVRDEAEIRGHRRTYVGARPGRIVRALTEAGSMNPVVLLDEVDKVGNDWRGDPSSALLEVLDPAQNATFRDHYLEVELDLSEVVFIATANVLETIPGPLLDRMEVISVEGYSEDEKIAIARDHLLPRLRTHNGIEEDEVVLDEPTLRTVVGDYTAEAGVRGLERRLDRLLRKAVTRITSGDGAVPIVIEPDQLREALGRPVHREDPADRTDRPGVATGLAVTGAGGDVLFVEAVTLDGDAGLVLTGQLGDVMRESGEIALSHIRANADDLGIDGPMPHRFHVHFPAGAVPKDGPSAGITMTTALVSLLSGRKVRGDVAMTGEVTLQGRVLPIGGVKEKALAAHRAGIRTVLFPAGNRDDAEEIPESVRAELDLHFVHTVDEALAVALERTPTEEHDPLPAAA